MICPTLTSSHFSSLISTCWRGSALIALASSADASVGRRWTMCAVVEFVRRSYWCLFTSSTTSLAPEMKRTKRSAMVKPIPPKGLTAGHHDRHRLQALRAAQTAVQHLGRGAKEAHLVLHALRKLNCLGLPTHANLHPFAYHRPRRKARRQHVAVDLETGRRHRRHPCKMALRLHGGHRTVREDTRQVVCRSGRYEKHRTSNLLDLGLLRGLLLYSKPSCVTLLLVRSLETHAIEKAKLQTVRPAHTSARRVAFVRFLVSPLTCQVCK